MLSFPLLQSQEAEGYLSPADPMSGMISKTVNRERLQWCFGELGKGARRERSGDVAGCAFGGVGRALDRGAEYLDYLWPLCCPSFSLVQSRG